MIHIDPIGGPRWRSGTNALLNRGKICIELDLKTDTGLQAAYELVKDADVVIENFRPGVMDRLVMSLVGHNSQRFL